MSDSPHEAGSAGAAQQTGAAQENGAVMDEVCPACGSALDLPEDLVLGEILYCDHCGVELEAVGLDPLRIDLFEEEEK